MVRYCPVLSFWLFSLAVDHDLPRALLPFVTENDLHVGVMLSVSNQQVLFGADCPITFPSEQIIERYVELTHVHMSLRVVHIDD